mmetsp:Transcript_27697/g.41214  ORF Transcript_27697/g.41214 Transcript_27697/m.41214 type:complete len:176 (-) Transcript_27697:246-773(-)
MVSPISLSSMTLLVLAVVNGFVSCGALATESRMYTGRGLQLNSPIQKDATPISLPDEGRLMQRRAAFGMIGNALMTTAVMTAGPEQTLAADEDGSKEDAAQKAVADAAAKQAAKERMEQRIAESKKNYRKPTDLVKERKDNTDYSCVASTGSPCPEGLVPVAVQKTVVEALEKFQ